MAEESLSMFRHRYSATYSAGLRAKLGLPAAVENAVVTELADELLELLRSSHVDWTSGFRAMGAAARGGTSTVRALFHDPATIGDWLARWRALGPDPGMMDRTNPVYIPRNHLVEEALDAATNGDLDAVQHLLEVAQHPFEEQAGLERYAGPAPQGFGRYTTYCGT
jgi:serine/tyrosine/threonine adenylyltransferase